MAQPAERVRPARTERVPPHNQEAEESVLGSMMLSGEAIASVTDLGLRADDFYRGGHRAIFEALTNLYARGEPVDAITAVEELRRRGTLDPAGGPLYVHHLVETVGTPASAAHYARIVSDHALLRRLIGAGSEIVQGAYDIPEDPIGFADQAEALMYAVSRRHEGEEIVPLSELVHESMEDLERLHERAGLVGLPTGFRDLDELLQGFQHGNLVIVAARPGIGKSSFVTNVARNIAVGGASVAMFSLEMSRMEIGMRMLCSEARVPQDRVRKNMVAAEDWGRIVEGAATLDRAPLFVVDSGNVTILDIRSKARKLAARPGGLGLVIVDYLQLMTSHQRVESRQQEVAEISRSLKLLAKELAVPVIAVSQLNRDPERRTDKRPQLADLRECVTGDTLVSLADGRRVPIRDLVGVTPRVLAVSEAGRIVSAESDRVWKVGRRAVFRVRLRSGREIRATGRHRLLGPRGWVRVARLRPGDRVAVARRLPQAPGEWADERVPLPGRPVGEAGSPPTGIRSATASGGRTGAALRAVALRLTEPPLHNRRWRRHQLVEGDDRWHPAAINRWLRELETSSDADLLAAASSDLSWDPVADVVADGEEDVFDLTVPGPSTWLADSIVSHNSGALEQDADVVMFIHRDEVYSDAPEVKGIAEVIVAKHRNGPQGKVTLTFRSDLTQFLDYAKPG